MNAVGKEERPTEVEEKPKQVGEVPIRERWRWSKEKRPLGIPVVKDRIVQTAVRNVIEPIFEKIFAGQSYGFRPGREGVKMRSGDLLARCAQARWTNC